MWHNYLICMRIIHAIVWWFLLITKYYNRILASLIFYPPSLISLPLHFLGMWVKASDPKILAHQNFLVFHSSRFHTVSCFLSTFEKFGFWKVDVRFKIYTAVFIASAHKRTGRFFVTWIWQILTVLLSLSNLPFCYVCDVCGAVVFTWIPYLVR